MFGNRDQGNRLHRAAVAAHNIRQAVIELSHATQSPHVGGALSCVEILASLHHGVMRMSPWHQRDILIFSKGHSCMTLYCSLSQLGRISYQALYSYLKDGGALAGHPQRNSEIGIELSTGALGHGLAIGVGWAKAFAAQGSDRRVFVIMGDGECEEGSVWEAALFATKLADGRLTAIIDTNDLQYQVRPGDICTLAPLVPKWRAFGWSAVEVDGHCVKQLMKAASRKSTEPKLIVARTVKAKGIAALQDRPESHGEPISDVMLEAYLRGHNG